MYKAGIIFIQCSKYPVLRILKYDCDLAPLDTSFASLGQHLLNISGDTLVLFDSSDCLNKFQIQQIIGKLKGLTIIITSRRRSDCFSSCEIHLKTMENIRCKPIFKRYTNFESGLYMQNRLGGFPLAICEMAKYTRKLIYNGDKVTPGNYPIADRWLKKYMNRNSVKLQLESVEIGFKASFAIRESLNVMSESSIALLGILGSMAFDYFKKQHIHKMFRKGLRELVEFNLIVKDANRYKISHKLLFRYAFFSLKSRYFFVQLRYFVHFIQNEKYINDLMFHALRIQERAFIEEHYREVIEIADVFCPRASIRNFYEGQYWLARRALKASKLLKDNRGKILYFFMMGVYYSKIYKNSEAIKYYDRVLRPKKYKKYQAEILFWFKAGSLKELGMIDKSIECYEKSIELAQQTGNMYLVALNINALGHAYDEINNKTKAIEYIHESISISQELKNTELELLFLFELAKLYYDFSNIPKFLNCIESIQRIPNKKNNIRNQIKTHMLLAKRYFISDKPTKSIRHYETAIILCNKTKDNINKSSILADLGLTYVTIGKNYKALQILQECLELCKNMDNESSLGCAYGNLGISYSMVGKKKEAIQYFEKSIKIFKSINNTIFEAIFSYHLGSEYLKFGENDKSLDLLNFSLEISITSKDKFFEGICLSSLGAYYMEKEYFDKAEELFYKSLSIANKMNNVHLEGMILQDLGFLNIYLTKYEKAIKYFEQCSEMSINCGHLDRKYGCLHGLGVSHLKLGNIAKAKDLLEKGLDLAHNSNSLFRKVSFLSQLGILYQRIGENEKARENYERVIRIAKSQQYEQIEQQILFELGLLVFKLGEIDKSIEYMKESLAICGKKDDKWSEASVHYILGNAYLKSKEIHRCEKIDDKWSETVDNNHLRCAYSKCKIKDKLALDSFWKSYTIKKESFNIIDKYVLFQIGVVYFLMGDFKKSIEYLEMTLQELKCKNDKKMKICVLTNLGAAYDRVKDFLTGRGYHVRALKLSQKLGNKENEIKILEGLADNFLRCFSFEFYIETAVKAINICREIDNRYAELDLLTKILLLLTPQYCDINMIKNHRKRALELARTLGNKQKEGFIFALMAKSEIVSNNFSRASEYAECALWLLQSLPSDDKIIIMLKEIKQRISEEFR